MKILITTFVLFHSCLVFANWTIEECETFMMLESLLSDPIEVSTIDMNYIMKHRAPNDSYTHLKIGGLSYLNPTKMTESTRASVEPKKLPDQYFSRMKHLNIEGYKTLSNWDLYVSALRDRNALSKLDCASDSVKFDIGKFALGVRGVNFWPSGNDSTIEAKMDINDRFMYVILERRDGSGGGNFSYTGVVVMKISEEIGEVYMYADDVRSIRSAIFETIYLNLG